MTHCCDLCSIYNDCQLKWYRGEKGEEQFCCPLCRLFYDCNPDIVLESLNPHSGKKSKSKKKK